MTTAAIPPFGPRGQIMLRKVVGHGNAGVSRIFTHADAEAAHLVAEAVAQRLLGA